MLRAIRFEFIENSGRIITEVIRVAKNINLVTTKKREISGILETLEKFKLRHGLILTEDDYEVVESNGCTIEILPIWYWLLQRGS